MTKSSAFTAPHVDHEWDSDEHTAVECDSWDSDEETVDGDYDDQDGEKYLDDDGKLHGPRRSKPILPCLGCE